MRLLAVGLNLQTAKGEPMNHRYKPANLSAWNEVLRAAFICGRDLRPNDPRSDWIDGLSDPLHSYAVAAYHNGQAERYEAENW